MKPLWVIASFYIQLYLQIEMADSAEKLSKNELKRRMKAEKKATEKAEKVQSAPPKPEAKNGEDSKKPEEEIRLEK